MVMLVGMSVVPFFFHFISKEEYGTWLAVNGLVALIAVVDMGTDQFLATIVADDEKFYSSDIGQIILSTIILKIAMASVILIVGSIIFIFISSVVIIAPSLLSAAKNAYLIAISAMLFNIFGGTIATILYNRHYFSLVNGFTSIAGILASLSTLVFLILEFKISAFPLALLLSAFIQYSILLIVLLRHFPHIKFNLTTFHFYSRKEMINYSSSFQVLRCAQTFRAQYIVIAINNLLGPSAVVLYTFTNRLPQLISPFASKIAAPFFPLFAQYFANEKMNLLSSNYLRLSKLLFRFSLFSAILSFVITKYFVTLWVGSSNYAGMGIMLFLAISAFVFSAMSGCGIVIFISKKFEKWVFWSFAEIGCAILLSYVLYLIFGFIGLVSGYVLASMITPIYLLKIVLKQLHLSYTEFLKNVLQYCFVTNLSTIFIAFFVISFVEISTWTELIGLCLLFTFFNIFCYEGFLMLRSKEIGINAKIASVFKL